MSAIESFAHPPAFIQQNIRHLDYGEKLVCWTHPYLNETAHFDGTRVQIGPKGEFIIDETIALFVEKKLSMGLPVNASRDGVIAGLTLIGTSILLAAAGIAVAKFAIPLFVAAGVCQLIGLLLTITSSYKSHQTVNADIKNWTAQALQEILQKRDKAFQEGFEYVLEHDLKAVLTKKELCSLYAEYLEKVFQEEFGKVVHPSVKLSLAEDRIAGPNVDEAILKKSVELPLEDKTLTLVQLAAQWPLSKEIAQYVELYDLATPSLSLSDITQINLLLQKEPEKCVELINILYLRMGALILSAKARVHDFVLKA